MDLILWRHAEAVDKGEGQDDLDRALTSRGRRDAERMAAWLDGALPKKTRIVVSPARRTQETVAPLGRKFETVAAIVPGAMAEAVLAASGWPDAKRPVLVVGHQPTLGRVAAHLLAGPRYAGSEWSVRKAGVWWLRVRERDADEEGGVLLWTVRAPGNV